MLMVVIPAMMHGLEMAALKNKQTKQEAGLDAKKMLRFSLERPKCTGLEMSTCEGQLRLSVLETELERQD